MSKFQKIARLHFGLLIFILFNFTLKSAIGFGVNNNLAIAAKLILYLSGVFLFFVSLKPFKKIAIYFSFFVVTPCILTIFYFVHGIFFGILSSLFLAPIMPLAPEYSEDNIKIYSQFNGFLGGCCEYRVTQNTFLVFEQHKGNVYIWETIDFQKSKITLERDSIRIESDTVYKLKLN